MASLELGVQPPREMQLVRGREFVRTQSDINIGIHPEEVVVRDKKADYYKPRPR